MRVYIVKNSRLKTDLEKIFNNGMNSLFSGNSSCMNTFNKKIISFIILLFLLLSNAVLYQAYIEQNSPLYGNTLRFHVRANSDKDEDQERKLIVRDAVLRYVRRDVDDAESAQELEKCFAKKTGEIAEVAANVAGGKPVHVYLTKERFPIRRYGTAIFPAGEYHALRVDIGRAEGHNWWCAFYPKLCYTPEKKFRLSKSEKKQWFSSFPKWGIIFSKITIGR